jgi:hypothetical protein
MDARLAGIEARIVPGAYPRARALYHWPKAPGGTAYGRRRIAQSGQCVGLLNMNQRISLLLSK